jgi:hypothetical protein
VVVDRIVEDIQLVEVVKVVDVIVTFAKGAKNEAPT